MEIRLKHGVLRAQEATDPEYPGIWVEYIDDQDKGENPSRPQVLIECPNETGILRALCWANPESEDYTDEIELANLTEKRK